MTVVREAVASHRELFASSMFEAYWSLGVAWRLAEAAGGYCDSASYLTSIEEDNGLVDGLSVTCD
jgi:hypothetical protein